MPVEIRVPILGESVVEAVVGKWLKNVGDFVVAGDPVVELETEKINLEVPAEQGGVLDGIAKSPGETVGVGDLLGTLADAGAAAEHVTATPPAIAETVQAVESGTAPAPAAGSEEKAPADRMSATPLARRVARESQVDLGAIQGSGIGGRITRGDVAAAVAGNSQPEVAMVTPEVKPATLPVPDARAAAPAPAQSARGNREQRIRMSRRRQTIARRLLEAQHTAAMLTTFNEVDMSAIMETRKKRKDSFKEQHGINLGFMSFFTKAVVGALKAFPRLNAEIQGDEIVLKSYYDIGIAVGVEEGLVVPVVRDADRVSFAGIEKEILDLATKARNNALTLGDLTGGTFTITNGGVYGSLLSTPILNAPQVGILGMHKIEERPIAVNGQVVVRPMMYLALSYDHRIVDGGEAVRFLVKVKALLEDPISILLET